MKDGDGRIWRFVVLGFPYKDLRIVSPYYKTRRGAEKWIEKHDHSIDVYLIQAVSIPAWMVAK